MAGNRKVVTADIDSRAFQRGFERACRSMIISSVGELRRIVLQIRNVATRYTAVDTGRAKAGWQNAFGQDRQGYWGDTFNDVPYTADLEMGTSTMAPQPMIRPALAEVVGVTGVGIDIVPGG